MKYAVDKVEDDIVLLENIINGEKKEIKKETIIQEDIRMSGILYGVGVGPGDPELMTYKAVRIIKECQVLAVPARGRKHAVSYRIAAEMIENMEEKEFLDLDTPMTTGGSF